MLAGLQIARVNGDSMQPYLHHNQYVLYQSNFSAPKHGDVILFERDQKIYIKRVYGVPHDTVEITDVGLVLVNGAPLSMDGLKVMGKTQENDMTDPVVLSDKEYFVLGDHRTVSLDSRNTEFGNVQQQEIIGVLLF